MTDTKKKKKSKPHALTPEQVRECMRSDKSTHYFARKFLVDRRTIRRAKRGEYNV